MDVPNPYAPPADLETTTSQRLFGQRDGLLAIRDGAELPHVCVISNVAVGAGEKRETKRLSSAPSWYEHFPPLAYFIPIWFIQSTSDIWKHLPIDPWMALIFLILFSSVILQFIWKRANVTFSLSAVSQSRFSRLRILGQVLPFLAFCFLIYGIRSENSWLTPSLAILPLIASFIINMKSDPLTVAKHHDGWFLLKGASQEFVASLPPV